jgi:hypothetical protein
MSDAHRWLPLRAGSWRATNRLWFTPTSDVIESPIALTLDVAVGDVVCALRYEWTYDDAVHTGILLVHDPAGATAPDMVWSDSFHTGSTLMPFRQGERTDTSIVATGSYAAPPGPDWGWRIALISETSNDLLIQMYNITPTGEEGLAVEARLTRVPPEDA